MSKHTPGPWRACEWTGHAATTVTAGDVVVAECSGHGRDSSESIADARLIAAAPELVEALKAWNDWYAGPYLEGVTYVRPPISKTRSALDKADFR